MASVAPADLGALVRGDALDAVDRLVGHQGDTGVEEVQALAGRGFSPPLAILAMASMPMVAIFSGYCWAVAPMTPLLTEPTPAQPPSTETMIAFLPAAWSAAFAPTAAGSLMV
jgi:hypothetical protein